MPINGLRILKKENTNNIISYLSLSPENRKKPFDLKLNGKQGLQNFIINLIGAGFLRLNQSERVMEETAGDWQYISVLVAT